MGVTTKQMSLIVGFLGVLSFVFGVIAENKKPASGTPITGKDVVICKYPADPTVALGYLSFGFLVASTLAGGLSLFYPYKGKSIPWPALFQSTSFFVFFLISLGSTGLAATIYSISLRQIQLKVQKGVTVGVYKRRQLQELKMPRKTFMGSLSSPKVDVIIDTGNPLLNHSVDGFLRIGTVAAAKTVAEETYHVVKRGSVSKHNLEDSLKKMCKEGAYWGSIAGLYVGMEYGVERVRGTRDWKNAMIGGALTGAIVSAVSNNKGDKIVMDAIAGAAVATASEFINYLT